MTSTNKTVANAMRRAAMNAIEPEVAGAVRKRFSKSLSVIADEIAKMSDIYSGFSEAQKKEIFGDDGFSTIKNLYEPDYGRLLRSLSAKYSRGR